ncbi:hypothetical protein [Brevundimonas sp. FT23042]|uniref:hypothetical protein n=1 Tax=Brevundimonas sp. FT23042 TaxID=3393749 RepID=UPI003B58B0CC
MPALDYDQCVDELMEIFDDVTSLTPIEIMHAIPHTRGKVYELYCVARLLSELTGNGLTAVFSPPGALQLKQGGGHADITQPHFQLFQGPHLVGRLYTDVEVLTLGASKVGVADLSDRHEIDVVLLVGHHNAVPTHDELLIGLECKAVADFSKAFVREALGRRRELSYYKPALDLFNTPIPAWPASRYRLVYIDPRGDLYQQSPAVFGVDLQHWLPSIPV